MNQIMNQKVLLQRLLVSLLVWLAAFGVVVIPPVAASPHPVLAMPPLYLADTPTQSGPDLLKQLETEILPKLEQIFYPDQREQFQASVADGMSFRKAFKSLMLTPEQKAQIRSVLQSVPKRDILASLTPDQKKQLFLKKREMFKPTAEDVIQRIDSNQGRSGSLPPGVKEKIDASLKLKDSFIPSPEAIADKIEAGMNALKKQFD